MGYRGTYSLTRSMCVCVCVCMCVCVCENSEVGVKENNDQEIEVFSDVDDDEIEGCEIFNILSLRGTKILVDLQKYTWLKSLPLTAVLREK